MDVFCFVKNIWQPVPETSVHFIWIIKLNFWGKLWFHSWFAWTSRSGSQTQTLSSFCKSSWGNQHKIETISPSSVVTRTTSQLWLSDIPVGDCLKYRTPVETQPFLYQTESSTPGGQKNHQQGQLYVQSNDGWRDTDSPRPHLLGANKLSSPFQNKHSSALFLSLSHQTVE